MAYSQTMLILIFALVAGFAFAQSPASSPAKSPTASPPDLQTPPPVLTSPPAQLGVLEKVVFAMSLFFFYLVMGVVYLFMGVCYLAMGFIIGAAIWHILAFIIDCIIHPTTAAPAAPPAGGFRRDVEMGQI